MARGLLKAFANARRLVYIEDQYFWSSTAAASLAAALRRAPDLQVIVVVARYPDRDSQLAGAASHLAREAAVEQLRAVAPDRVAVYDLENRNGTPIYVHSKVCVVDDLCERISMRPIEFVARGRLTGGADVHRGGRATRPSRVAVIIDASVVQTARGLFVHALAVVAEVAIVAVRAPVDAGLRLANSLRH